MSNLPTRDNIASAGITEANQILSLQQVHDLIYALTSYKNFADAVVNTGVEANGAAPIFPPALRIQRAVLSDISITFLSETGATLWTVGIDISDGGALKIVEGNDLGLNVRGRIGSDGVTAPNLNKHAVIAERAAPGVAGGTAFALGWTSRPLNWVFANDIGLVLSAGTFTLPVGTYLLEGSAPAYQVDGHVIRLQNLSTATEEVLGTKEFSAATDTTQTRSEFSTVLTVTNATHSFNLQHYVAVSNGASDLGRSSLPSAGDNVYALLRLEKIT